MEGEGKKEWGGRNKRTLSRREEYVNEPKEAKAS